MTTGRINQVETVQVEAVLTHLHSITIYVSVTNDEISLDFKCNHVLYGN